MNHLTMENQPLAGPELEPAAAGHAALPEWLKRPGRLALSVLAIAAGGAAELAVDQPEAQASYVQRIQPVKARVASAGHHFKWVELDSAPYGYYLGQFNTSDPAKVLAVTKAKDYDYLAVRVHPEGMQPFWECGWAKSGNVDIEEENGPTSGFPPCAKQLAKLATQPYSFAHLFNCAPGECNDGTYVTDQTSECDGELDRNDKALDLTTTGVPLRITRKIKHPLYDLIEKLNPAEPIHYRFTALDNKAVVVRSDSGTWGLMSRDCVAGHPTGGPPNTDSLVSDQKVAGVVGELSPVEVFA